MQCVLMCLLFASGFIADPVEAYLEECKERTKIRLKSIEQMIPLEEARLAKIKRAGIRRNRPAVFSGPRFSYPTREEKEAAVSAQEAAIRGLEAEKEMIDNGALVASLTVRDSLRLHETFKIGFVGPMTTHATIIQVLDDDEAIARLNIAYEANGPTKIIGTTQVPTTEMRVKHINVKLVGWNTKDWTDDLGIEIDEPVSVLETWEYETLAGKSRILVVERLRLPEGVELYYPND